MCAPSGQEGQCAAVSRTNSAAKQLELKIEAFPMSVFVDAGSKAHPCLQHSSDIDGHEAGRQEILVRSLRCADKGVFYEAGWRGLLVGWLEEQMF